MCNSQNAKSGKIFSFSLREDICLHCLSGLSDNRQTPSSKASAVANARMKEGLQTCTLKGGQLLGTRAGTEGVSAAQALASSSCAGETATQGNKFIKIGLVATASVLFVSCGLGMLTFRSNGVNELQQSIP